ncbi:hypothetical protein E2C01_039114 [Portunus trituberculatus]|uniref:Uncharacterized protein n=1 Tax=Portunus trituberculatus TaxID=210409 RepID=A0A5B7FJ00_PORTR|nr:hypothetical protein [Portunus trituberculatus]
MHACLLPDRDLRCTAPRIAITGARPTPYEWEAQERGCGHLWYSQGQAAANFIHTPATNTPQHLPPGTLQPDGWTAAVQLNAYVSPHLPCCRGGKSETGSRTFPRHSSRCLLGRERGQTDWPACTLCTPWPAIQCGGITSSTDTVQAAGRQLDGLTFASWDTLSD